MAKAPRSCCTPTPHTPTLFTLFTPVQVDQDGSKEIEFAEFIHAIQINKAMSEQNSTEQDTLDAWSAVGGNVSHAHGGGGRVESAVGGLLGCGGWLMHGDGKGTHWKETGVSG